MKQFNRGFIFSLFVFLSCPGFAQNVWTQHNDQARTGWYPYETTLNTNNVNQNTFGFYFNHTTDDKVVSQPLVIKNVNMPNVGFKNIVYVTTLNNTIYAYDADVNADPYWTQNYTNKISVAPGTDCVNCRPARNTDIHPSLCGGGYGDFSGNMGIVGTPVVDTTAGTMYFVTKIVNPNDGIIDNHSYVNNIKDEYNYTTTCFHQYLHAIDIRTGTERPNSPVEITPVVTGTGDGQTAPGLIKFNPRTQFNRAGLVLSNGMVYIVFAAHCDNNPSHGWIISYDAGNLALVNAYIATPNDGRGGIWMSGTAPAVDEGGNIYFTTGNSLNEDKPSLNYNTYNALPGDPANRGEGVVKLTPNLTLSSYFTPFNYIALNDADKDFPTQVMLIPNTQLAMTGCKDNILYIMNKTNLGGFNAATNNVVQTVSVQSGATMHSSFAYFGGTAPNVFQFSENSSLKSYPVSAAGLGTPVTNTVILGPSGGSGGFLSVSSNGPDPATGILWAYQAINGCNANNSNCHAILHALKASDITSELWNSDMVTADQVAVFNKFSCPTIALGKVYIAANTNHLYVYGLKSNTSCVTNVALHKPAVALTTAFGSAGNVTDGNFFNGWGANPANDIDSIYVDLQGLFDICRIAITWENNKFGKDFDLKVSDDKINWTTVSQVRGNTDVYTEINNPVSGRYVNMVGIKRGTTSGYGIIEFQVFGNPASSCRAPGGLSASSLSPSSEHISWSLVSGAAQYFVKYRSNLSSSWIDRVTQSTSIDLSALTCGSVYYYTVQADCGSNQSAVSQGSFTAADCAANSCDIFPVRYYHVDLGDIGMAGTTCKTGNIYQLSGSGTDIGGNSDQFQFAYTNIDAGNYVAYGRIIQQDPADPQSKFGIMVRDSLTNTSRFAFVASINRGFNLIFEYRDIPAGPVTTITLPGHYSLPFWARIGKSGTKYTAYVSPDNINWTQIGGTIDLQFGNDPANIPNYGMAITSVNNTILTSGQIDNFTVVVGNPLPVTLKEFTARKANNYQVLISWATTMEHLLDHFEVQRSSGVNSFETIKTVGAAGESETTTYYSVLDDQPLDGMNYYRLKETDKDNKFYYSPVASVSFDKPSGIEIYPNPADDYTNIRSSKDPIVEINLYDVTGKLLQSLGSPEGQNTVFLNTESLEKGMYIVRIKTTKMVYKEKLFKR